QSAAFGGVFTGFGIAADWESGFARRLLLGAPHRGGLIFGYIGAALVRWLVTGTALTVVALLSGMNIDGNGIELGGIVLLGLLVSTAACLWGAGIAMRFKTLQAGPLMQIPVFLLLFMAPVYVPQHLLAGWIHSAAGWNPITAVMNGARGFLAGVPHHSGLAFACGAGMVALFSLWAVANLRRVERGQ
ncbi:MAG: hypothetical protein JWM73_1323, partial [Solirubrobacterales bacterium]|nr:hypothetical protein [Solirubrobacterales bacterium]